MVFVLSPWWWGVICGWVSLIVFVLVLSKLGWLGDKADDDE